MNIVQISYYMMCSI